MHSLPKTKKMNHGGFDERLPQMCIHNKGMIACIGIGTLPMQQKHCDTGMHETPLIMSVCLNPASALMYPDVQRRALRC